jgi:hypothetical protein
MVPDINTILQRFTGGWAMLLQPEAILTVCREIGYTYTSWRDRVLTPVTTMQLFLRQILHGNTACSHLPHLSGMHFTAAAYAQARARLPIRILTSSRLRHTEHHGFVHEGFTCRSVCVGAECR